MSVDVDRFQKYFVKQIHPSTIAENDTDLKNFVLMTAEALLEIQLGYWKAILFIATLSPIEKIYLSQLYVRPESTYIAAKPPLITSVSAMEEFDSVAHSLTW